MSISIVRASPLVLLAAALVLYAVGLIAGAAVLMALGAICELGFWFRLFTRPRSRS